MASTAYVPAWKKLGLKLKSANGAAEPRTSGVDTSLNSKKRKEFTSDENGGGQQTQESTYASKKMKKAASDITSSTPNGRRFEAGKNSKMEPRSSPNQPKYKKVSFTSNTKVEDGDSTKDLYKTWLTQQDSEFNLSNADEALREISVHNAKVGNHTLKDKKSKETKKPKQPKPPKPQCHKTDRALRYLIEYDTSKSTWKFNKAMQSILLANAFDTLKLPSSHDHALRTYLVGLAGKAARSRLRSQAKDICQEDDEALAREDRNHEPAGAGSEEGPRSESSEAPKQNPLLQPLEDRKSEYITALYAYKAQLSTSTTPTPPIQTIAPTDTFTRRLYQRLRAELLLYSLSKDTSTQEPSQTISPGGPPKKSKEAPLGNGETMEFEMAIVGGRKEREVEGVGKKDGMGAVVGEGKKSKRQRKRKKRVLVEESSSESSSSSDSEGSDSDGGVVF